VQLLEAFATGGCWFSGGGGGGGGVRANWRNDVTRARVPDGLDSLRDCCWLFGAANGRRARAPRDAAGDPPG